MTYAIPKTTHTLYRRVATRGGVISYPKQNFAIRTWSPSRAVATVQLATISMRVRLQNYTQRHMFRTELRWAPNTLTGRGVAADVKVNSGYGHLRFLMKQYCSLFRKG